VDSKGDKFTKEALKDMVEQAQKQMEEGQDIFGFEGFRQQPSAVQATMKDIRWDEDEGAVKVDVDVLDTQAGKRALSIHESEIAIMGAVVKSSEVDGVRTITDLELKGYTILPAGMKVK
jgi:ribonuclease PH